MQEDKAINGGNPVREWSPAEIERLKRFAPITASKRMLLEAFPDRTLCAIKVKLSGVRKELGEQKFSKPPQSDGASHTMLDRNDPGIVSDYPKKWAAAAARSNDRFLAALCQIAA